MKKNDTPRRIILKLRDGSLSGQGFPVSIESGKEGVQPTDRREGHLPAHPEILELFDKWKMAFKAITGVRLAGTGPPEIISCENSADRLKESLNHWLNRGEPEEWRKIRDFLVAQAAKREDNREAVTRLIVQTNDSSLWQLPWSALDLSPLGIKAEIAFSWSEWKSETNQLPKGTKVRILAVFGDNKGIDTDVDHQLLQTVPPTEAKIEVLTQPSKTTLLKYLLNSEGWHIFFFAGHSSTDKGEGKFQINHEEILTVDELKNHFKVAIEHGLQLAIFNSCDGVGLAKQLAELNLPQSIVMRLPVPDEVAKKFLQLFLERFAKQGKSLYAAVYETRGLLADQFGKKYPGVEWLPMICQNPAVVAGSWEEWTKIRPIIGIVLVTIVIAIGVGWLYYPSNWLDNWLDGPLKPVKVELSSANYISSNDETKQQKPLADAKLYHKDQYRIEITTTDNNTEAERYVYAYQLSKTQSGLVEILDLMKLFGVAHQIDKQQKWVILPPAPPRGEKGEGLKITTGAGTEKICVLAYQQENPYLEGLSVDNSRHITGHQSFQYFFRNVNKYLEKYCDKETSGKVTFENMGERNQ